MPDMFGGSGGGRSNLRMIRLGALVAILIIGFAFHDHGSTYSVLHGIYLVVIVGVLLFAVVNGRRSGGFRGRRNQADAGPHDNGHVGSGGFGSGPPQAPPTPIADPPTTEVDDSPV
jgi:hypothetical protein